MITVVIATAFLIAIGVVILGASTKYLVSVYMDRNSNENLYDAEGVLAEVRAGLLEYAGDSSVDAYKTIVENYETVVYDTVVDEDGTEKKVPLMARDRFARMYIDGIISRLSGETHTWDSEEVNVLPLAEGADIKSTPVSIDNLKKLFIS